MSAIVGGAGFLAFPASIGVAILRFHLYDLDVVVRKTVLYAALAVFATVVYLAIVVGVGAWLGRGSSFLTMVAAVVVAVTFQPVRTLLTRLADRVVYGRRATPYEVLSEFSERVGGAYSGRGRAAAHGSRARRGVGPSERTCGSPFEDELRDVATWPSEAGIREPVQLEDGSVPATADIDDGFPVEHAGSCSAC